MAIYPERCRNVCLVDLSVTNSMAHLSGWNCGDVSTWWNTHQKRNEWIYIYTYMYTYMYTYRIKEIETSKTEEFINYWWKPNDQLQAFWSFFRSPNSEEYSSPQASLLASVVFFWNITVDFAVCAFFVCFLSPWFVCSVSNFGIAQNAVQCPKKWDAWMPEETVGNPWFPKSCSAIGISPANATVGFFGSYLRAGQDRRMAPLGTPGRKGTCPIEDSRKEVNPRLGSLIFFHLKVLCKPKMMGNCFPTCRMLWSQRKRRKRHWRTLLWLGLRFVPVFCFSALLHKLYYS